MAGWVLFEIAVGLLLVGDLVGGKIGLGMQIEAMALLPTAGYLGFLAAEASDGDDPDAAEAAAAYTPADHKTDYWVYPLYAVAFLLLGSLMAGIFKFVLGRNLSFLLLLYLYFPSLLATLACWITLYKGSEDWQHNSTTDWNPDTRFWVLIGFVLTPLVAGLLWCAFRFRCVGIPAEISVSDAV